MFSIIFKSTLLYPILQNALRSPVGKNLGPPMPKWSNDSYLQINQAVDNMHSFYDLSN